MGIIRVIMAIIIGLGIIDGISTSFIEKGKEQAKIMLFTTGLIIFEAWLIGG